MKKITKCSARMILISWIQSISFGLFAQGGPLDPSFAYSGIAITSFEAYYTSGCEDLAVQTDGKIVLAGFSGNNSAYETAFTIVRHNVDGSLDASFDVDGIVRTEVSTSNDGATSVAIQEDGKIVAAGISLEDLGPTSFFAVVRYNSDGSLDNSFDSDGIVTTLVSDYSSASALAIQSDGKILAGGKTYDGVGYGFALVRYNEDGSLDNSFGGDGIVTTLVGFGYLEEIVLQADGKILAFGYASATMGQQFCVVRYNLDGTPDSSFDSDGIVYTDFFGAPAKARTGVVQADGKIVAGGWAADPGLENFALARYNADGSLDETFGDGDGIVITHINEYSSIIESLELDADGKILAGGFGLVTGGNWQDFAIARYEEDGHLDASFNSGDVILTPIGSHDFLSTVALQNDGKILGAGTTNLEDCEGSKFVVVRYSEDLNVGLLEEQVALQVFPYPNPFTSSTTLKFNDELSGATIRLFNILGEEVSTSIECTGSVVTIYRNNLPAGNYYIQITEENRLLAIAKVGIF